MRDFFLAERGRRETAAQIASQDRLEQVAARHITEQPVGEGRIDDERVERAGRGGAAQTGACVSHALRGPEQLPNLCGRERAMRELAHRPPTSERRSERDATLTIGCRQPLLVHG
jgi:hypothetical protein